VRSVADALVSIWCGTPPADPTAAAFGWLLIAAAAAAVAVAVAQAVWFTWRPEVGAHDRVKRSILDDGVP